MPEDINQFKAPEAGGDGASKSQNKSCLDYMTLTSTVLIKFRSNAFR